MNNIRVTVWNEYRHEKESEAVANIYPQGIHSCIAEFLGKNADIQVRTATLDEPDHGLSQEVVDNTDVMLWWGHMAHNEVSDEVADRVVARVRQGMGLIVLHSGHASKVFTRLMGTETLRLRWREDNEKARLWSVAPGHPITQGVPETFVIPLEETYGEHFSIPEPDQLIYITWYPGGEVFRGGCCFNRGAGKIFYFHPGHESFPTYHQSEIQTVITNAVRWAAPVAQGNLLDTLVETGHTRPPEGAQG